MRWLLALISVVGTAGVALGQETAVPPAATSVVGQIELGARLTGVSSGSARRPNARAAAGGT
jgi:hypothetical protein